MSKIFSLKTISALALSLTVLLGGLLATPVTSAFAKPPATTTPKEERRDAYSARNIDNDGDELNESSEQPYVVLLYSTLDRRAEGKWTKHAAP
jgi:hypothetical protein